MVATSTGSVVRLHADADGYVWLGTAAAPAADTHLDADDLFASGAADDALAAARVVRLIGSAANAALIVRLSDHVRGRGFAATVQVGSPASVPAAWLAADPAAVLQAVWHPPAWAVPSPGWHDLGAADYCVYKMIDALGDRRGNSVPDVVKRAAERHPAWPAVTFVTGYDRDAACRLMCDVIDPRWYRHPTRPGRWSKLFARLGLTPVNAAHCAGEAAIEANSNRAATAVRVWYNRHSKATTIDGSPGSFLLRQAAAADSLAAGLLSGTRRLVALVAGVWADAVCTRRPHMDGVFDPARFFRDAALADEFRAHLGAARRV